MRQRQNPDEEYGGMRYFSGYFTKYMSSLGVIIAALPIPATGFGWIPTFYFQRQMLATSTTLLMLLCAGLVFYYRAPLARHTYRDYLIRRYLSSAENQEGDSETSSSTPSSGSSWANLAPVLLALVALVCIVIYWVSLQAAVRSNWDYQQSNQEAYHEALNDADPYYVEQSEWLAGSYIGIFVSAEVAFLLMALKEYQKDVLEITEDQLMADEIARYWKNLQGS
jgi:hypothetical protein